jgi:hypothetical protein
VDQCPMKKYIDFSLGRCPGKADIVVEGHDFSL